MERPPRAATLCHYCYYSCQLFWTRKGEGEAVSAFPCAFISVLLLLNCGEPKSLYWGKSAKSELTFCSGLGQGSGLGSGSGRGWAVEQLQVSN